jgi:hypothetical protein
MCITESHKKKIRSVQKGPSSPVLRPLEGKAAATWTSGAYKLVREHGQGARTPLACLPKLKQRHGGLFQHSQQGRITHDLIP